MLSSFRRMRRALVGPATAASPTLPDIDPIDRDFISEFDAYTMTSLERRYHLLNSIRYIVRHDIPGSIVECGVWRGGNMMLVARALMLLGITDRNLVLFDTFAGMPPPGDVDADFLGRSAQERMRQDETSKFESNVWAIAKLDDVVRNMQSTGYPFARVHYRVGRVEETLPSSAPDMISLLRLDTDWYESTRHELLTLYPRVASGGVIIIDDYGYWKGARKAVDEFLETIPDRLLLHRIDDTCRSIVKP